MAAVTRDATVYGLAGPGEIDDGNGGTVETMNLALIFDRDTSRELRVSFMLLASDYEALGSPGYGDTVTVTLDAA